MGVFMGIVEGCTLKSPGENFGHHIRLHIVISIQSNVILLMQGFVGAYFYHLQKNSKIMAMTVLADRTLCFLFSSV